MIFGWSSPIQTPSPRRNHRRRLAGPAGSMKRAVYQRFSISTTSYESHKKGGSEFSVPVH
jgi:hypothetical protein